MTPSTKRYAVFGHPIQHSFSPQIHTFFGQQHNIKLQYDAKDVPMSQFQKQLHLFFQHGQGLNITAPLKKKAYQLAQNITHRAQIAQSVNTLWLNSHHQLCGDNTDGIGLITYLTHILGLTLKNQRILIAGAGGAVQGILKPLLDEHPQHVLLINRTPEKAEKLAQHFMRWGPVTAAQDLHADYAPFDFVINGTSSSVQNQLPPIATSWLNAATIFYDLSYGIAAKFTRQWAKGLGLHQYYDGLGMLVEQAAEAFHIWHQHRPQTKALHNMLHPHNRA